MEHDGAVRCARGGRVEPGAGEAVAVAVVTKRAIPTHLTILGIRWEILEFADADSVDLRKREQLWGQCDGPNRKIRIMGGLSPEEELTTIVHEAIHAILGEMGREDDETFVAPFAAILADTLVRNGLAETGTGK